MEDEGGKLWMIAAFFITSPLHPGELEHQCNSHASFQVNNTHFLAISNLGSNVCERRVLSDLWLWPGILFWQGFLSFTQHIAEVILDIFVLCFIGKDLIRSFGNDLIWITEKFRGPEVTIKKQQQQQQKSSNYKMFFAFNILNYS